MSIEQAKERANAATPGPWTIDCGTDIIAPTPPNEEFQRYVSGSNWEGGGIERSEDAIFIARARTEYPLVLDVIKAADDLWVAVFAAGLQIPGLAEVLYEPYEHYNKTRAAFEAATE